jgi:hypothetical protein
LRSYLVWAGLVYVAGALGIEFLEGSVASGAIFGVLGEESVPYRIVVIIQEAMEMAGLVLFVAGLLWWIRGGTLERRVAVELT